MNGKSSFGTWEVSTESNDEGYSFRLIGIFIGTIPSILQHLADKGYKPLYTFKFDQVETLAVEEKETVDFPPTNIKVGRGKNPVWESFEVLEKEYSDDTRVVLKNGDYYLSTEVSPKEVK